MQTFSDLCNYMADKLTKDPSILYEVCEGIKQIICEYNRLGFLTCTSQPGREYDSIMYKSEYHRYRERTAENILCPVIRKQRAYVAGYMKSQMADFIFNKLQYDPYLYVRTSNNDRPVNFDIKFGSVHFHDGEPVLTESKEQWSFEETRNTPDAHWSFNFNRPVDRFPFCLVFGQEYPDIDPTDIIRFDIVDIRWNQNDYLWTKLLEIINNYQSINS